MSLIVKYVVCIYCKCVRFQEQNSFGCENYNEDVVASTCKIMQFDFDVIRVLFEWPIKDKN